MEIELIRPCVELEDSFRAGLAEFPDEKGKLRWMYRAMDKDVDATLPDFSAFVKTHHEREHTPAPNFVTTVCFWAIWQDEVMGRLGFRWHLNDYLRQFGGHVGYVVRPTYRRRGIATKMLEKLLQTPEAKSVGRLLVICDEGNEASEKVILRNGGVFEGVIDNPPHAPKKRFWIELAKSAGQVSH